MKDENNKLQESLMILEKENIVTRFFKWVANIFRKKEEIAPQVDNVTIPKAVKMPEKIEEPEEIDENSLEYLYQLSDEELNDLNDSYDQKMEEAQKEILQLDNILQTYKQSIKKLQGKLAEDN